MKRLIFILNFFILFQSKVFAQDKILDQNKYAECLLAIPIDYRNMNADFEESKKYTGIEIIMIRADSLGRIKTMERGFIKNFKDAKMKGAFFEVSTGIKASPVTAKFPTFNAKNTFCYNAACFDKKN